MKKDTGLRDCNGKKIYAGDVLCFDHPGLPEITKEEFERKEALYKHMTFYNQPPQKATPPSTDRWVVEWDAELAGWKVPRDYDGMPDLFNWYKEAPNVSA